MYHGNKRHSGSGKEELINPQSTISKYNYSYSFDKQILPTSSRSSLRSMEKLENSVGQHLPAFEYEFKRKPYASFNNYSIIPPIKTKSESVQESSKHESDDEQRVEMLLEQEINSYTQKQGSMRNKNNFSNSNNVCT